MRREHLARNAGIRPAGDLSFRQVVINPEALPEAPPQSALPSAAGSQQGPINIEEQKFLFQASTLTAPFAAGKTQPTALT